jgi:sec-independent protein translocase protein TatA
MSGLENPLHLALLILVVFLVFGAKRVPEMARGLGTGLREIRQGIISPSPTATTTDTSQPAASELPRRDRVW